MILSFNHTPLHYSPNSSAVMKISTVLPGAARWEFSSSWKENTKTSFASEREREREGEIAPLPVNDGNKNIRLILTETRWKKICAHAVFRSPQHEPN